MNAEIQSPHCLKEYLKKLKKKKIKKLIFFLFLVICSPNLSALVIHTYLTHTRSHTGCLFVNMFNICSAAFYFYTYIEPNKI